MKSSLTGDKNVIKSGYRFCLSARQADGWNKLRKDKFHPSCIEICGF